MAKRFSGHVILVTGGSSGIGFATCRKLLAEGAKVMVHGLTLAEARDAVKRLGRGAKAVGGDLGNPKTCARIVTATVRAFGRIDGLANNAGIYPRHSIEQADEEVFDRLFHINTRAPLLCAKAAIEADLRPLVQANLHRSHEELTRQCEVAIRTYDPCISCATHFLDLTVEHI